MDALLVWPIEFQSMSDESTKRLIVAEIEYKSIKLFFSFIVWDKNGNKTTNLFIYIMHVVAYN